MLRAWTALWVITAGMSARPAAAAPAAAVATAPPSTSQVAAPESLGTDSPAAALASDTLVVADSLEDLDDAIHTLRARRSELQEADRRVFDELLDAAGEMAANGDTEAARLLIADARRWIAAPELRR